MAILTDEHALPVQRACQIARFSRTAYYRALARETAMEAGGSVPIDAPIIDALGKVLEKNGRWGFWKCFQRLRALGHPWNHKRVHRVYRALGLNQVRRTKKRVPTRDVVPLGAPPALNETWALDFMGDSLFNGRSYRLLNVLDEGNREALAIAVDVSLPSARVVEVLDELVMQHGAPRQLRCDNGPEFLAEALRTWCEQHGIRRAFIQPGKPNQNAYIERFNRSFRQEVLDAYVFTTLEDVRTISAEWRLTYNTERAHESLGDVPPLTFLPRPTPVPESRLQLSA